MCGLLNDIDIEYYQDVEAEVQNELLSDNCVAQSIKYRRFVSRSKGWRNGRRRIRRHYKEVHLVRYNDGFHLWHRFPFDVSATEIIGAYADGEMLKDRIIELWGY